MPYSPFSLYGCFVDRLDGWDEGGVSSVARGTGLCTGWVTDGPCYHGCMAFDSAEEREEESAGRLAPASVTFCIFKIGQCGVL